MKRNEYTPRTPAELGMRHVPQPPSKRMTPYSDGYLGGREQQIAEERAAVAAIKAGPAAYRRRNRRTR